MTTGESAALEHPQYSRKDRVISKIAALLASAVYRDVSVHWIAPPPVDGPELSLSNHFGGLSDGIVLIHALPRRPGIIAKDVIWKIPPAGAFMNWIGGIPVHQPKQDAGSANDQMFASCYDALRDGRHLLIFPEGVTRDEPSIARVKTGSARIALGARASGVEGLVVTPIGIHYEDKAALRSRVVVIGGPPIRIDAEKMAGPSGESGGADDRAAVQHLTERFDTELRRVAPDFEDWNETRRLQSAAEVALRSYQDEGETVSLPQRDRLANVLADRSVENRQAICETIDAYEADLDGLGLTDAAFTAQLGTRRFMGSLAFQLLIGLILLPFAIAGALLNLIPFVILKLVGLVPVSPAVLATVKPAVAVSAYSITWGIEIWAAGKSFGLTGIAAAIVLIPTYSIAALAVFDRFALVLRLFSRWRSTARTGSFADRLTTEREAVVHAVLTP